MLVVTLRLLHVVRFMCVGSIFAALTGIPTEALDRGRSLCVFQNVFGTECLGCGMTRALSAMLHASVSGAIAYNKLVVVVFPLLCLLFLKDAVSLALPAARAAWHRKLEGGWPCRS